MRHSRTLNVHIKKIKYNLVNLKHPFQHTFLHTKAQFRRRASAVPN